MKRIIPHMVVWFERYIQHKDIIAKKIQKIDKKEDHIIVTYKDKTQDFFFFPILSDFDPKILDNIKNPSIVMINSHDNINELIKRWPDLIKYPKLSLYSINPFSEPDNKWILFPYTHHQISDSENLEAGLKSIFETIEPITPDEYAQKI